MGSTSRLNQMDTEMKRKLNSEGHQHFSFTIHILLRTTATKTVKMTLKICVDMREVYIKH